MTQTPENLRFLLWKRGTEHASWTRWVAQTCGVSDERALHLLTDTDPEPSEARALARALGVADEDLRFGSLLEDSKTDVTRENLRRLLAEARHGSKKALAAAMDVHPTTVSRWLSGEQRPPRASWRGLCRYFGLHPDTNLAKSPIFLEHRPMGDRGRRDWLRDHIERLGPEELTAFYPALERLLEPR